MCIDQLHPLKYSWRRVFLLIAPNPTQDPPSNSFLQIGFMFSQDDNKTHPNYRRTLNYSKIEVYLRLPCNNI